MVTCGRRESHSDGLIQFESDIVSIHIDQRSTMPKESEKAFKARMAQIYKDDLIFDNSVLFCKVCEIVVNAKKLSGVKQHLDTAAHKSKKETRPSKSQTLISKFSDSNRGPNLNPTFMEICELFLEADIPLKKLRLPAVQQFLEKHTKCSPSETTIRKNYVPAKYTECIEKMRAKAKGKHIWVSLDETTDVEQRLIANFVFGILDDESERGRSCLLEIQELESHDSNSIATFFNDCLLLLYPEGDTNTNKIRMKAIQLHTKTFFWL